jgi:membrane protein DedA with SNARE-associated domain
VFVETGLLIGFFLPGDSLLATAGIFADSEWRKTAV